jgi:pyruvate formate lyase activating enzyme
MTTMKPQVANLAQAYVLDQLTAVGELWHTEGENVRCVACGHRCLIGEGKRGICKVRFTRDGELQVPWGYVAGLQSDPVEKKPFFHVHPGSDALTFGMLGCDLHCAYCFPGETMVVTQRGLLTLAEAFRSAERVQRTSDAEIAYPEGLQAVAASGNLRPVRAVFKHHYQGRLVVIRPYYLPELRCTPDHRVYATDDPARSPQPIAAGRLTRRHFLVVPRHRARSSTETARALEEMRDRIVPTRDHYLVPVCSIASAAHDGDVYNMEVEEEHNYLAGFFLVSNCQNWQTSQALRDYSAKAPPNAVTPEQLVAYARREGSRLVVSSYNEPLITAEWAVEVFKHAGAAGFTCGFVSNGNATPEVLDYLRPWIKCYKVDLKGFNDRHYRTLGCPLESVTNTIRMLHERGIWVEVVTLVVPGFNDDEGELRDAARFLASVSREIPWHVTGFHKDYKMTDPPDTDARKLVRAAEIGTEEGLRFVYAGNRPGHVGAWENTRCPGCGETVIERYGFLVRSYRITPEGQCPHCHATVPGVWPRDPAAVRTGDLSMYGQVLPRRVR